MQDVSEFLVLPDDLVGRTTRWACGRSTTPVTCASFDVVLRDGTVLPATRLSRPSWNGAALLVVIAPTADVVEKRVR